MTNEPVIKTLDFNYFNRKLRTRFDNNINVLHLIRLKVTEKVQSRDLPNRPELNQVRRHQRLMTGIKASTINYNKARRTIKPADHLRIKYFC